MKIKSILTIITACSLVFSLAGCKKTETVTKQESEAEENQTENDAFNASAYVTAYLNCYYKGDTAPYAELSGESEDTLLASYNDYISTLLPSYIGQTQEAPGAETVSPQLYQDYTDLWKNIYSSTKYQVTAAEQTDDHYTITLETQQMELYTSMANIIPDKMNQLYENESDESSYAQMMLDAYLEAMENIQYADAATTTVSLVKGTNDTWEILPEDMQTLNSALIDLDVAESGTLDGDSENLQTEATPNQEYPENLDDVISCQVGETITLKQDGQDKATFCINSVKVTDERNEYDPSTPEKVIVVNYTYQNIGNDDPLIYDQMSFQILEGERVCDPYYIESLLPADIASKGGDPITASLAYQVSADCKEVIVYVDGVQINSPFQVKASIS